MRKKVLGFLLSLVLIFISPTISLAQNNSSTSATTEFSTSYVVTYDVQDNGITNVTQKIALQNLTSNYYVSNFTLTIGSTTISNVSASDEGGPMEATVENKGNKTAITVKFNTQVAGANKVQAFTMKFSSKDFAQSIGKTWEVNLPKIPTASNIGSYNLVLSVPVSFGDPTSISPTPRSQTQTFDRIFMSFDKDQLQKNGVSVNFGTTQLFDFSLKYNLENSSLFPVITSISLPADTPYQDILISRIDPAPLNVTVDNDGNYLAWFRLPRSGKTNVLVNGSAKLYINSKNKNPVDLTSSQIQDFTKADKYWEKDNPTIKAALSDILKDGVPKSNRDKALAVYKYVVNTLKYDTGRLNNSNIERLGAVTALNNPNSAVCMEFTDLFITLARGVGVPAREMDGFAYSQNKDLRPLSLSKDLLHAWPEYFDNEKGWVMIDPTWENTSGGVDYFNKFDLNHLTLATKGVSSVSPLISDDVSVTLSKTDFLSKPHLDTEINIPESILAGFPSSAEIKVTNNGQSIQQPTQLFLSGTELSILGPKTINLGPIPPYGYTSYKLDLRTPFVWKESQGVLEAEIGGQTVSKKILVEPFFLFQPIPYFFGSLVLLIGLIYGAVLTIHIKHKQLSKK